MSFYTESQSIFRSSNIADGRFWDTLVVTGICLSAGMEDMNTHHHHLLTTKICNNVVVVQAAAMDGITTAEAVVVTIVLRHEKTWVWMVPKRNNVSLCT
jgi:hypothetical protein